MKKGKQSFCDTERAYSYKLGKYAFVLHHKNLTLEEAHPYNVWKTLEALNSFIQNSRSKKFPDEVFTPVTQEQWESIGEIDKGVFMKDEGIFITINVSPKV